MNEQDVTHQLLWDCRDRLNQIVHLLQQLVDKGATVNVPYPPLAGLRCRICNLPFSNLTLLDKHHQASHVTDELGMSPGLR